MQNALYALKASIASGSIYFGGDITVQVLIEKKEKISFSRSLRFSAIGFLWAGPFCRLGSSRINQLSIKWYSRTALDQSILLPINMAMVNILKPISEGDTNFDEIGEIWKEKYPEVLIKGKPFLRFV